MDRLHFVLQIVKLNFRIYLPFTLQNKLQHVHSLIYPYTIILIPCKVIVLCVFYKVNGLDQNFEHGMWTRIESIEGYGEDVISFLREGDTAKATNGTFTTLN